MSYSFQETPEQTLLCESAEKFAKKHIDPVAADLFKAGKFSVELARRMGKEGYLGIMAPPRWGGMGLSYTSYIKIVEIISGHDGSCGALVAAHNSLGVYPVLKYGSASLKKNHLRNICSGEYTVGFAQTEPNAGTNVKNITTRAEYDPVTGEWNANGGKHFITNVSSAMAYGLILLAVTGSNEGVKEFTAFFVPIGTPGLIIRPMPHKGAWPSSDTGEVFFENVRIPDENKLGKRGQGLRVMLDTLDGGRKSVAAMGSGIAKSALRLALAYAKQRIGPDKPIAELPEIYGKLAEMSMRINAAELLLYKACWLAERGKPCKQEAAEAKLLCSQLAEFCTREGKHIFGAVGIMPDFLIWRLFCDTQVLPVGEGTDEVQKLVIARCLGCFDRDRS